MPKNKRAALVAILCALAVLLSGCARLESPYTDIELPPKDQSNCGDILRQLDNAVDQAGVSDTQAARIPGFPYYRVDRFLASFAGQLNNHEMVKEWLERLRRLGDEGRRIELANLPKQFFPGLPVEFVGRDLEEEMDQCARRLMESDMSNPKRIRFLREHAIVQDDYSALARVVGLYPVSRWFILRGLRNLQKEARVDFQRPAAMKGGKIYWYIPDHPRPGLNHERLAAILEQALRRSALGIPNPDAGSLEQLFEYYAPMWRISTRDDSDRIGRPFWKDNRHIEVDTSDPVVYRYHTFTRIGDQALLQLNYVVWFPRRPSKGFFDLYSGHLDGLIWRVTLDHHGRVLLYDSIHPCGCFHKYYPVSPALHPFDVPRAPEPPLMLTKDIPNSETGRVVIHLKSREHYVVGLSTEPEQIGRGIVYRVDEYAALRSLPYGDQHRSMFETDGLVSGTDRAESWFVWPMGVNSAGAMRQVGHHAIALVGRQHFDDARLFESVFIVNWETPVMRESEKLGYAVPEIKVMKRIPPQAGLMQSFALLLSKIEVTIQVFRLKTEEGSIFNE